MFCLCFFSLKIKWSHFFSRDTGYFDGCSDISATDISATDVSAGTFRPRTFRPRTFRPMDISAMEKYILFASVDGIQPFATLQD